MRVLHFEGTPARMGEAFGESCREAIAELYALRLENAIARRCNTAGATSARRICSRWRARASRPRRSITPMARPSSRASREAPGSRPNACSP